MFEFTYFELSVGYRLQPTREIVTCCLKYLPNNYRIITEKRKILPIIMLFVKSRNKKSSNSRTKNSQTAEQ